MVKLLTRDAARKAFSDKGLSPECLTPDQIRRLRHLINQRMKASGLFRGEYRMRRINNYRHLTCKSDYFDGREAVSFNSDGFIGFAGWASDKNVQPILEAFFYWLSEISYGVAA